MFTQVEGPFIWVFPGRSQTGNRTNSKSG